MKFAYLVSGLIRDIEFCAQNQLQNLIEPLDADVFICTSDFINEKIVDENGYPKDYRLAKIERGAGNSR